MSRTNLLHTHVLNWADPESPSKWVQFGHKIEKTAWAIWDHKKAAAGFIVLGVAASIAMGVATGGVSLLAQFAIGAAYGLAKTSAGKVYDYIGYKQRKGQLQGLDASKPEKIGREGLRAMKDNLDFNSEHLKTSLFRATEAFVRLQRYENDIKKLATNPETAPTYSRKGAAKMMKAAYDFYFEYDRALHYFSQYETFVEFSHAFVGKIGEDYNQRAPAWDDAIAKTVQSPTEWHRLHCRKSIMKRDICYGNSVDQLLPGDAGVPHHTCNS